MGWAKSPHYKFCPMREFCLIVRSKIFFHLQVIISHSIHKAFNPCGGRQLLSPETVTDLATDLTAVSCTFSWARKLRALRNNLNLRASYLSFLSNTSFSLRVSLPVVLKAFSISLSRRMRSPLQPSGPLKLWSTAIMTTSLNFWINPKLLLVAVKDWEFITDTLLPWKFGTVVKRFEPIYRNIDRSWKLAFWKNVEFNENYHTMECQLWNPEITTSF